MATKHPKWFTWFMGIAGAVLLSLATWVAGQFLSMRDDVRELKLRQTNASKFWKLHSWNRDQINRLRQQANLPLVSWPDLEEKENE